MVNIAFIDQLGVPRILSYTTPEELLHDDSPEWPFFADYIREHRININIRQVYESKEE
jgi:hypothetical protein